MLRSGSPRVGNTIATPIELLFGGAHGFVLSADSTITSDWINLNFLPTDTLVCVLDDALNDMAGWLAVLSAPGSVYDDRTNPAGTYNLATQPAGFASDTAQDSPYFVEAQSAYTLTASPGSFVVTPAAATIVVERKLPADKGLLVVTGSATNPGGFGKQLAASTGAFAVTPVVAQTKVAKKLPAPAGSFGLSPAMAGLKTTRKFAPSAGVLALSGQNGVTAYTGVAPAVYSLDAATGAFGFNGTDLGSVREVNLVANHDQSRLADTVSGTSDS
jgi:hypothetical protein